MLVENISFWIMTGLLERFPALRIAFVEPGIEYVVMWLRRLDSQFKQGGERLFPGVKKLPSEYFREQMFLTFVGGDSEGLRLRHEVGVENILWSTDFPHPGSTWPHSRESVDRLFVDVPPDERQLIVAGNASRLYGL
jgi:predicted TIM-barrel fold metal-dependent hydrolase